MQQTEERLRRMILDMEIGPGERLTERWLEGQTGASRSSIRTALFSPGSGRTRQSSGARMDCAADRS
ncbi:GntR family transcriptional regulator [Ralstonia solanacearum]|nr:GntR family transcriptional regulator [Ralstonia solanacearum]MDB0562496.1 GntR family transcriptional regulator [Ralstonia solanacearum]